MCLAFGVQGLDDVGAKLENLLELQPPAGLVDKVRSLGKLKSIADSMPKDVSKGSCQEVVLTGNDVDLDVLPIMRCWPGDPAPFITLPAVITRDPNTGVRNVGMYRMQKIDRRSTFMHWQIHKDGRADLLASPDGTIPVAVAIGLDPVTAYSASAPAARSTSASSWSRASSRARRSSSSSARPSTSRCPRTRRSCSKAPSPATTWAGRPVRRPHRLLHAGRGVPGLPHHRDHHAPQRRLPVDRGRRPARGGPVAGQGDRAHLPARDPHDAFPRSSTTTCPTAGAFHNCVIVSIRKRFPGHAKKVMYAVWGLGLLSLSKSVVVVDEGVDVHDYEAGLLPGLRERRPEARRRPHRRPARPARPLADAPVVRRQAGLRRDREGAGGGRARVARADRA